MGGTDDGDERSELVTVGRPRPEVAVVTLDRPEVLNALSFTLVDELHSTLETLHRDNTCRVVVLTGAGRGFCSGLDLANIEGSSTSVGASGPRAGMLSQEHIAELPIRLRRMQQPVIAAVNGVAYGGGMALAMACDVRIAATTARFSTQFIKVGLSGCDLGISYTLPRAIGSSRAFELMLTARRVEAEEAERLGIVSEVVPDALGRALELADLMCDLSPFATMMTKEVMWANLDAAGIEQAVHLENRTQILASTGGEVAEAAAAFMEKRRPDWTRVRPQGIWA